MNNPFTYDQLSPTAKIRADEFLQQKFYEATMSTATQHVERYAKEFGVEPTAVMFDAANLDNIDIHITGTFTALPHQVLYAIRDLYNVKCYVIARNRAAVSAIANTQERWNAVVTATLRLQEHTDRIIKDIAVRVTEYLRPRLTVDDGWSKLYEEFIVEAYYPFDIDGNCLEE